MARVPKANYICARLYLGALTQGGQHDAQLSAHDCAVALLVEDAQALNVVIVGSLGEGVNLLQHGQEGVEVQPLVGHVCRGQRRQRFRAHRKCVQ